MITKPQNGEKPVALTTDFSGVIKLASNNETNHITGDQLLQWGPQSGYSINGMPANDADAVTVFNNRLELMKEMFACQ